MTKRIRLHVEALEDRCLPSFSPAASFPVGANPQAVVTADFNNDGHLDLATANPATSTVSVLLGDGRAASAPPSTLPAHRRRPAASARGRRLQQRRQSRPGDGHRMARASTTTGA